VSRDREWNVDRLADEGRPTPAEILRGDPMDACHRAHALASSPPPPYRAPRHRRPGLLATLRRLLRLVAPRPRICCEQCGGRTFQVLDGGVPVCTHCGAVWP
jgi:hypothetical protein